MILAEASYAQLVVCFLNFLRMPSNPMLLLVYDPCVLHWKLIHTLGRPLIHERTQFCECLWLRYVNFEHFPAPFCRLIVDSLIVRVEEAYTIRVKVVVPERLHDLANGALGLLRAAGVIPVM